MPGIDPSIVEHNIDTWHEVSPILQNKRPIHLSKAPTIKNKIEKLWKSGFIYPNAYTTWVSNPIPVNKNKGTIHACTDFCDLNLACPKDNFPTLFIDQIIDSCAIH